MARNTRAVTLPKTAEFVGGPMDGQTVQRQTGRFAGYKNSDGKRTGFHSIHAWWTKPLMAGRHPKRGRGYRLALLQHRERERTDLVTAQYWYADDYWRLAREDDEFWRDDDEWRDADKILARYPSVDPNTIDLVAPYAADALHLYEQCQGDTATDLHGQALVATLLQMDDAAELRERHDARISGGAACRMCARPAGTDPWSLRHARMSLVVAHNGDARP